MDQNNNNLKPDNQTQELFNSHEIARKAVHFFICVSLFLFAHFVDWSQGVLIAMVGVFGTFLLDKYGYLNYFQRIKRSSKGHYWMFFGVLITFLMYKHTLIINSNSNFSDASFAFALMSLGLADPLSMFGKPIFNYFKQFQWFFSWAKYLTFERKTFTGTIIYVVSSLAIILFINQMFGLRLDTPKSLSLAVGIIGIGIIEFFSIWGFDNLFIPVLSFLLLWMTIS